MPTRSKNPGSGSFRKRSAAVHKEGMKLARNVGRGRGARTAEKNLNQPRSLAEKKNTRKGNTKPKRMSPRSKRK